jgi:hypothetical protein
MDKESEQKIKDILQEVFADSISLETKELIFRLLLKRL